MKTTRGNDTVEIRGHVNLGHEDRPKITEKAISVTVDTVDGCSVNPDSAWLPKSIASRLAWRETRTSGVIVYELTAIVPAWWVRKLDTRPDWQKRGGSYAPQPVRL